MAVLVLTACSSDDPSTTDPGRDLDPAPYVADETDAAASPSMDAAQLESAVETALTAVFSVDPALLFESYASVWDARDDGTCPYYYPEYLELYGQYIWYDDCAAESGATFSGYAYYYGMKGVVYDGYTYDDYDYFYGDATLVRADGQSLTAAGYSYYYNLDYWYYGYRNAYGYLQGTFVWEGEDYADTWLATGASMDLYVSAVEYTAGGRYLSLDGSLSDISGDVSAVSFENVYAQDATAGGACEMEPGGSIAVRDADGAWYEIDFEGAAYGSANVFPADCDGCGEAYWRGEPIGTVCPDFSSLLVWEGRPWN